MKYYTVKDLEQDIWLITTKIPKSRNLRDWTWLLHLKFNTFLWTNFLRNDAYDWDWACLGNKVEEFEGGIIPSFDDFYLTNRMKVLMHNNPLEFILTESFYSSDLSIRYLCKKLNVSIGWVHYKYVQYDVGGNYKKRWEKDHG